MENVGINITSDSGKTNKKAQKTLIAAANANGILAQAMLALANSNTAIADATAKVSSINGVTVSGCHIEMKGEPQKPIPFNLLNTHSPYGFKTQEEQGGFKKNDLMLHNHADDNEDEEDDDSDIEKTLGKCNRCNINEAVTYGPSGSYAVWCQDCADAYDKDYEEKNPYVKCISCESGYHMPTGTDATTFKCMSCEFSGK